MYFPLNLQDSDLHVKILQPESTVITEKSLQDDFDVPGALVDCKFFQLYILARFSKRTLQGSLVSQRVGDIVQGKVN